jgi:DEAD/DEAH box helicase domain-containing protein
VRSTTDVTFMDIRTSKRVGALRVHVGTVDVTETITGYQRIRISTGATLALEPLDMEPSSLLTRGVWYEVPDSVLEAAGLVDGGTIALPGALHAAEHCGIGVLPLFAICDRWDVGGVSIAAHPQTGKPTVVIYDGYPGGSGVAELGFEAAAAHLGATRDVLATCPCTGGCPSCVQSPKCGNGNEPLDKDLALAFLRAALA